MLDISSILSMVLHVIVTFTAAFFLDNYYRFRFNQVEACFRFYGLIPHSYLEKLREYYNEVSSTVIEDEQLRDIDNH